MSLTPESTPDPDDFLILARHLEPTEAHLLCACLWAAGITANTGDTHLVQMHSLLSPALGGAKVRVPQSQWVPALEVLQAFRRGELALGEDFDVGEPSGR